MATKVITYQQLAQLVIDKLEGGYYHPDMYCDGRMSPRTTDPTNTVMVKSGETLFGIDRGKNTKNTCCTMVIDAGRLGSTDAANKFWEIIDTWNSPKKSEWKYNYLAKRSDNPELYDKLIVEAANIIITEYKRLRDTHIKDDAAKSILEKDVRQAFHFLYGVWNGDYWFKKFAASLNQQVKSGVTDSNTLAKKAIETRLTQSNPIIQRSGQNMIPIFNIDLRKLVE